ncbi:SurA N-terminal domain-containing protein [Reinekea blandensis]|uniref:Periplasmic chaperone PpiD n=1 Tax=Reinekea blandensis MED297 TaxID=314283 RepID=A4BE19_9GAMM|nr:SurA N-terminal domain-containing protein [Reinekea blandensis]EAR09778.1 peptidyl-prolyl cis-trans isomerase D, putative [Reinekea blandensis MED297]
MLDALRNSARGTAGKVIVGLIVITFTLFGAESIISIAGNSAPATVNGEDISEVEYQRLLSRRQQELTSQFGAEAAAQLMNSSFVTDEIIESLISQELQMQLADKLAFDASEDQVVQSFADIPAFQIDGEFSQDRYLNVLAANGFNHQSFVAAQKEQAALAQFQSGVANSAFVVEKAIDRYANLIAQERSFQYKAFESQNYLAQVEVSDGELRDYYEQNQEQFLSEESVKVRYLTISLDSLAEQQSVTEQEIQSEYDSYVASLNEDNVREISHILFADGDDNQAEAQAALTRLNQGEEFADLASELSDDPGSAEFGGSLGELIPDVYVDEFYDAALELSEVGQVSAPVETQYGVHLIRLDALNASDPEPLSEVRDELVADIRERKAQEELLLVESQLSDAAFSTDTIEEVAELFQTEVISSDWITRSAADTPFDNPEALEQAFSAQVIEDGLISSVVRLENSSLLALQKEAYAPEDVESFEAVVEEVRTILTAEKAEELMHSEMASVIETQQIQGDGWETADAITRNNSELPSAVVSKAFELPQPIDGLVLGETSGDSVAYVVALTSVTNAAPDTEQREMATALVENRIGGSQYQIIYNQARNKADITVRR